LEESTKLLKQFEDIQYLLMRNKIQLNETPVASKEEKIERHIKAIKLTYLLKYSQALTVS